MILVFYVIYYYLGTSVYIDIEEEKNVNWLQWWTTIMYNHATNSDYIHNSYD